MEKPPPILPPEFLLSFKPTGLPSDKFYLSSPETLKKPRLEIVPAALGCLEKIRRVNFFNFRKVVLAFGIAAAIIISNEPAVAVAPTIPVSPTELPGVFTMARSGESSLPPHPGKVVASVYGISVDELSTHTRAITKIESGGKPIENPMQVSPETAAESMSDLKKRIGEEKFNQIILKMDAKQREILAGELTFARYYFLIRNTFDEFNPEMQLNLALISYNGGIGLTGEVVKNYLFYNPKVNKNMVTWREVYNYMRDLAHASAFQTAYQNKFNFERRSFLKWLENVNRYLDLEAKAQLSN